MFLVWQFIIIIIITIRLKAAIMFVH
jgi:hypothetical protein